MENRLSVGISHGDVNGISYELIIKLLAENRMCELCVPILYGSPKVAAYYRKALNAETFALNPIKEPSEANGKRSNIINCADDEVKVELGKETDESDRAAMAALKRALDHADGGHIDVVVAAPQGKGSFLADFTARDTASMYFIYWFISANMLKFFSLCSQKFKYIGKYFSLRKF